MKSTTALTTNTSVQIGEAIRTVGSDIYEATIFVTGTFGGGTVVIQASPDNGTTKVTLKDTTGTVVSVTANDVYNVRLGNANKNGDSIKLYATMSGSTSPTVSVAVFDNR